MRVTSIFLLLITVVLFSCKGGKAVPAAGTGAALAIGDVIKSHQAASPNFSTMAARLHVVYETDEKLQSITTSVRIEKDKIIWIKASVLGITLAKVKITPQRVSFYETIGKTYFDGNFALLSEFLGTEIDFQKTQDILLGQSIFELSPETYSSSLALGKYKLLPNQQASNFIHSLMINQDNYKIASETVSQPSEERILTVKYAEYQELQGSFFPSEILVNTSEKDSKTKIEMTYRKIDLNVSISFPFTIPEGYEEIVLN